MQPEEYEQLDDNEKMGAEQSQPFNSPEKPSSGPTPKNELPGGTSNEVGASERANPGSQKPQGYDNNPSNFGQFAARSARTLSDAGATKGKGLLGRRKLWMAVGAGSSSVALIIAAIFALLPLKLEHILKNVIEKRVTNKAEYMLEKRMDKMVIRFLFEQANASAGAGIYTDPSLLKTMYGNWKLGKFEEKFTANTGYKIEQVVMNGRATGGIRLVQPDGKSAGEFTDPDKFEKFLGDNKGLDARRLIRTVTRDQTKWYQIYQRRNLRRFMRNAYGIRNWSFFTGKKGPEADASVRGGLIDEAMGPYKENAPKILGCALEGKTCPAETNNPDKPYGEQDTSAPKSGAKDTAGDSGLGSDASGAVDDATNKVKDQIKQGKLEKGLSKILSTFLSEELSSKIASKAIPVVGQILLIDQAARIDNFFNSGNADKAIRTMHKVQYATAFTGFKTKADNFKDNKKQMSADELNTLMTMLNGTKGNTLEDAASYQDLIGKKGGKKLDQGLEASDTGTPISDNYNKFSLTLFPPMTGFLRGWYLAVDTNPALKFAIDAINSGLGTVAGLLTSVIPGADYLAHQVGAFMSKLVPMIIKPAVDGTEVGADLMNIIDMGGAVVGQDFAKVLGGHTLSLAQSKEMQSQIALNKARDANPSLKDRLFSPDRSDSMVSKLAMLVPTNPGSAMNQFAALSASMFRSPFSNGGGLMLKPAYAASTDDLHGLTNIGATAGELDQSLDENKLDVAVKNAADRLGVNVSDIKPNDVELSDCPDFGRDKLNLCRLDLATIQSGNPMFTKDDDGGLGETQTANQCVDATPVDGTVQSLAKEMLDNPNITYWTNNGVNTRDVVVALSEGKKAYTTSQDPYAVAHREVDINPNILKFIVEAGKKTHVMVNALTDKDHSPNSNHYKGEAVDFDLNSGPLSIIEPIAAKYGGSKNNEADHHHFDFPKNGDTAAAGVGSTAQSSNCAPSNGSYTAPIANDIRFTQGRTDMGVDIESDPSNVGKDIVAIGRAKILHIQNMGAFGPTWISYKLLDGPKSGSVIFIGHSGPPVVHEGDEVPAGKPIIKIHGGSYGGPPGHIEIGWGSDDGTNTLAAANGHYSHEAGNLSSTGHTACTTEGKDFRGFLGSIFPGKGFKEECVGS